MGGRSSFILLYKYNDILKDLNDKQAGVLIKAIFEYQIEGKLAHFSDLELRMAFKFIQKDLDYNNLMYDKKCLTLLENAKKGGAPTGNKNADVSAKTIKTTKATKSNVVFEKTTKTQKQPNGCFQKSLDKYSFFGNSKTTKQPKQPNRDDNDNDNDNDNDKEKRKEERLLLLRSKRRKKDEKKKETATASREPSALVLADKPQVLLDFQGGGDQPSQTATARTSKFADSSKALSDAKDTSCDTSSLRHLNDAQFKALGRQKDATGDKPSPRHLNAQTQMFEAFKALYKAQTGDDYLPRKDEFVQLANLIRRFGIHIVERKIQILHTGCKNAVFWFTKSGFSDFTIGNLVCHWNELVPFETQEQKQERSSLEKTKEVAKKIFEERQKERQK
jgi:hypothetical protein